MLPVITLVHPAGVTRVSTRSAATAIDPALARQFADRASRSAGAGLLSFGGGPTIGPSTTPDTAPPTTAAPATTATTARHVQVAVATIRVPPTTRRAVRPPPPPTTRPAPPTTRPAPPTTQPPPPPTTQPPPQNVAYGEASWDGSIPAGTCANNAAPMGAILTVTNTNTGKSVTCQVVSRGPYVGGRIVDLAQATFAQLAPPGVGLIPVKVTW